MTSTSVLSAISLGEGGREGSKLLQPSPTKWRLEISRLATGRYTANDYHGYMFALMPGGAGQAPSEEKKMMKRDEHKISKKRHMQALYVRGAPPWDSTCPSSSQTLYPRVQQGVTARNMGGGAGRGKLIEVASRGFISTVSKGLPPYQARAAHLRRHVGQREEARICFFSRIFNGTQV